MGRMIGSIAGGTILAVIVLLSVEGVSIVAFPPDRTINFGDPAQQASAMMHVPVGAKLPVLLGWFLAGLAGGYVADRIDRRELSGYIVGALIAAAGVWTMVEVPRPLWMQVGGMLLPFAGAFLAEQLARRRY